MDKTNLLSRFALLFKSEPEKTFIKAGIMEEDGSTLTKDGWRIFKRFLVSKFGEEFKTTIVDKMVAELKADKSDK